MLTLTERVRSKYDQMTRKGTANGILPKTPVIHVVGVVQGQEENNVKGDIIMKFGFRTPSFKRSISARSTGRAKRAIKRAIIPGYGKRGIGLLNNPKKSIYNRVYRRATFGLGDIIKALFG